MAVYEKERQHPTAFHYFVLRPPIIVLNHLQKII